MPKTARFPLALVFSIALAWPAAAAGMDDGQAQIARLRAEMDAALDAECRQMLREAADPKERADVALALGAIVGLGLIGDADVVKASSFYSLASELDSAEADCALGEIYAAGAESRSGRIAKDVDMALEYYRRAAVGGSVKAMMELSRLYFGELPGVERDPKKAITYLIDAASRGNPEALARLEPDMQKAKLWEDRHPGRKAGFPTSKELLIKQELIKADIARNDHLDKTASHVYVELSRRTTAVTKPR